jgi:competence protein ComEA
MIRIVLLLFVITVCACSSRVEISPPDGITQVSAGAVNINTASVTELERLPYIGRKTAESIVAFREANGPFRRTEQLMLIRGVSETRFVEIRHLVKTK